ncbi:hypothetical protein WNY77_02150 [Paraglaciecola mesophila]|uniref:Polysaccharide lyase n=1 Tax=Paraglaciecola mesophila TaxID=197222 RepID=A0ABU9SRM5_9ALTE
MSAANEPSTWLLIDDFERGNSVDNWTKADTKNETKPLINEPQVTLRKIETTSKGTNAFLLKKPAPEGVVGNRKALTFKALPQIVEVGEIYTFYTRINVAAFPNNHAFGLSNMGPEDIKKHDYNAFEATLRVTDKSESSGLKNTGALMVKVSGGYANVKHNLAKNERDAKPLESGQWYQIWYVVNNAPKKQGGQTYDVYLQGGGEFPEQTLVYKNASFRMQREWPLTYFLMNCNTGPLDKPYGNGGLKYDDIYMTKGIELTNPS